VKDAGIRVTMSVLWACLSRPILGKSEEAPEREEKKHLKMDKHRIGARVGSRTG
jgi:hypothetical protein